MEYLKSDSKAPLRIIDDNKGFFRFFKLFGLFPIYEKNGAFKVHDKICVIIRLLWFLWHFAGLATILFIKNHYREPCHHLKNNDGTNGMTTGKTGMNTAPIKSAQPSNANSADPCNIMDDLPVFLNVAIGIFMFILVDPVQTIILWRNINFIPRILKEIKHLEAINLGNQSTRKYNVSKIYLYKRSDMELRNTKKQPTGGETNLGVSESPESSSNTLQVNNFSESNLSENMKIPIIDVNDDDDQPSNENSRFYKCYHMLRYIIVGVAMLMFLAVFVYSLYLSLRPKQNKMSHDIKDEWKFFGGIFYLVFPVVSTWFCVFFIGFQRKMYKVINELPDSQFLNDDLIENIGDYFESMQKISRMLIERIYRFTFGINFALFVIIGTGSTYELIQGLTQDTTQYEFGDIIYVFPIAVCVFHLFLSCQQSSSLISGQHDKLRYKLKGIMTSLVVTKMEKFKDNEKKFKRVELLYKNLKDFSPQAEVYGGFKVTYSLFTGMLLFMFTYSRIFHNFNKNK